MRRYARQVEPQHDSVAGTQQACELSLVRLGLYHLDLYLLHWRGNIPLEETVEALSALQQRGRIRAWGVSNFDVADMEELVRTPGGERCATNQIYYPPVSPGPDLDLVPWLQPPGSTPRAFTPLAPAPPPRTPTPRCPAR